MCFVCLPELCCTRCQALKDYIREKINEPDSFAMEYPIYEEFDETSALNTRVFNRSAVEARLNYPT